MINLHDALRDPARLRQRLIMAEILARRGQGPLALFSYAAANKRRSLTIQHPRSLTKNVQEPDHG